MSIGLNLCRSLKILCIFFILICFIVNGQNLIVRSYAQSEKENEDVLELIDTIKEDEPHSQMYAIDALGYLGDVRAVAPLLELLSDRRLVIRWKVYVALSRIGQPQSLDKVAEAINKEDKVFWDTLIQGMCSGGQEVLDDIVAVGQPLVERLTGLLKHQNFQVRNMAKIALEEIQKDKKQ